MANASLHSMNTQNRHDLRRVRSTHNFKQQVSEYNKANSKPGIMSKAIDKAIGYDLIGSVVAVVVVSSIFTIVI
jgi:hypothetical protein